MEKEKLIKLSGKLKKIIHHYDSSSDLFIILNKDKVFKSLPLGVRDKIYLSFLIFNSENTNDLSKLYDKIERALFKSIMTIIEEIDVERPCKFCDDGEIDCTKCDGNGEIDCTECDGDGEESMRHDFDIVSKRCQSCHGGEVVDCPSCDATGLVKCTECNGDGEVEVFGSALTSTLVLYSFNPQIFNSLEFINNRIVNDDIYDKILNDKFSCITHLENDENMIDFVGYDFREYEFDWALKDQIILDSLSLI